MNVTIPDFKPDEKLKEDEGGELGDVSNPVPDNSDESDEQTPNNTYPLISSATIPAEFLPYISLFIFYGNMFGKNLTYSNLIISLEAGMGSVGQCSSINGNQNKLIKINAEMWPSLNETYREQLIFHEAAHCLLGRAHRGNNFFNPQSIMNVNLFPDYLYTQRYNEFIYELFEEPVEDHQFVFGQLAPHE